MKKWTRFLAAFLSLLMLLSLAACGASADGVVKNLLGGKSADAIRQKDYKTTAEFYHAVEMRRMQELLGLLTGTTNLETVTSDTVFFQNELKVQLNQNVLDPSLLQLLTSSIGMDVSWAKSAAVTFTSGKQNNLSVLNAALLLNGKNIISANTVMDNASSTVYVAIPEINEQYFSVNLSDVMRRNLGVRLNASQLGQLVTGSWIDSAKLTALVEKYYGIALENINNVQLSEGSVSANGVSCSCTVATVTLTGRDYLNVARACLEAARNDDDLKQIAFDLANLTGEYNDSALRFYSTYDSWIQDVLDDLNDANPDYFDPARMTVYIDAKGEILGRSLEIQSGRSTTQIYYRTARDGSKFGLEAEYSTSYSGQDYYDSTTYSSHSSIKLTGSGSYSSSGKLSGEFQLGFSREYQHGTEGDRYALQIGTVKADGTITRDGFIGELVLTPSDELINQALNELRGAPESVTNLVRSLTLAIVNKSSGDKTSLSFNLRTNGKDLLVVSFSQTPTKAVKFEIPANSTDLNSWGRSLGIASISTVLSNLEAAGVPKSLTNEVTNGLIR